MTEAQIADLLDQLRQLVRLIGPLTALLSGASGMSGGAGERLEQLIQQLTGVSVGLHQIVEGLTRVMGPEGAMGQIDGRLSAIEARQMDQDDSLREISQALRQILGWMQGAA
ncbi:hypothetical protein [Rhodobacter capsulatus]|uniref:hypothetical protein n=1 Tax=Rhodobacter capsulatus TaxID=1061 RepID=UPI00146D42C8|nr:hypothetical protein [Rhodobacter capsulatus]